MDDEEFQLGDPLDFHGENPVGIHDDEHYILKCARCGNTIEVCGVCLRSKTYRCECYTLAPGYQNPDL